MAHRSRWRALGLREALSEAGGGWFAHVAISNVWPQEAASDSVREARPALGLGRERTQGSDGATDRSRQVSPKALLSVEVFTKGAPRSISRSRPRSEVCTIVDLGLAEG